MSGFAALNAAIVKGEADRLNSVKENIPLSRPAASVPNLAEAGATAIEDALVDSIVAVNLDAPALEESRSNQHGADQSSEQVHEQDSVKHPGDQIDPGEEKRELDELERQLLAEKKIPKDYLLRAADWLREDVKLRRQKPDDHADQRWLEIMKGGGLGKLIEKKAESDYLLFREPATSVAMLSYLSIQKTRVGPHQEITDLFDPISSGLFNLRTDARKITLSGPGREGKYAARLLVETAVANGWRGLKLSGKGASIDAIWLEARKAGLEVDGAAPSTAARQAFEAHRLKVLMYAREQIKGLEVIVERTDQVKLVTEPSSPSMTSQPSVPSLVSPPSGRSKERKEPTLASATEQESSGPGM